MSAIINNITEETPNETEVITLDSQDIAESIQIKDEPTDKDVITEENQVNLNEDGDDLCDSHEIKEEIVIIPILVQEQGNSTTKKTVRLNERSLHPSHAQVEVFVQFLEENPNLAKGYLKSPSARERSRQKWEDVTERLNSIGGTIKSCRQWMKYWSDKKSAIKKKVAARAAARRKTGGEVEDIPELTKTEERIASLLAGDTHLGIRALPESSDPQVSMSSPGTSPKQIELQDTSCTDASHIVQQRSPASQEALTDRVLLQQTPLSPKPHQSIPSTSSQSHTTNSPSSIFSIHRHKASSQPSHLSPPHPPQISTPSRIEVVSDVPHTTPSSPPRQPHPLSPIPSPLPHGSASQVSNGVLHRRVRARTSRGSRNTRTNLPSPPSQHQTEFSRMADRFLRLEERQLEIQESNSRLLRAIVERCNERERDLVDTVTSLGERIVERVTERDRVMAEAVKAMGEGLKALAEAINKNS